MKSKLGHTLRKQFDRRLEKELGQFSLEKCEELPGTDRLYEWRIAEGLTAYVLLVIAERANDFTIELAWSRGGTFPTNLRLLTPVDIPECDIVRDEPEEGNYRFRLSSLWDPREDHWWHVSAQRGLEDLSADEFLDYDFTTAEPDVNEEDLRLLDSCVDDAMMRIHKHAVPYFEKVTQEELKTR